MGCADMAAGNQTPAANPLRSGDAKGAPLMQNLLLAITISSLLFAAGCSRTSAPSGANLTPSQVVDNYLDAVTHSEYKRAYQYISNKDKVKVTSETFVSENMRLKGDYMTMDLMRMVVYKIDYESITGTTAEVSAIMRLPLMGAKYQIVTSKILSNTASKEEYERASTLARQYSRQTYQEQVRDGGLMWTFENISFKLKNEHDGWKIFLDIGKPFINMNKADSLFTELVDTAVQLKQSAEEHKTQEQLDEIKKLESRDNHTSAPADKTTRPEKSEDEYIKDVELRDFGVSLTPEGAGIFYGELINHGTSALKDIEITIHGLNDASNEIFTVRYHPLTGATDITRKYLMPGQSIQFSNNLPSTPKKWDGTVNAKITNLKLADN